MRRVRWSAIVTSLSPLLVMLAGVGWGRYVECFRPLAIGQLAFVAGGVLGIAGLFPGPADRQVWVKRLTAASLLAYMVLVGIVEPLMFVFNSSDVVFSVAWLVPIIAGGVMLPGRGYNLTGLGCWSVLFSGTVALGFNVSHSGCGMGFLMRWLS